MEEIEIVDDFMNKFEFRNYVNTMFYKHDYKKLKPDDERWSDDDFYNDNDLLVTKDGVTYTVQTYLNIIIGNTQLEETVRDMKKEKVYDALLVTNMIVDDDIRKKATEKNIVILDRNDFNQGIYD